MNEQTLNIKFVQEVEKYPCLYNYTLGDYSRKDATEKAWSEVGKIFNLTHSQCKEKWKNLRAVFVRHTKPAPSGSSSKYKKPYYLADAMQFTIPYIKALNNTMSGNLPQAAVREVTGQKDNDEANESQSILQQNISLPQNVSSPTEDMASPMSSPLPESSLISNQPLSPMSCPLSRATVPSTDTGSNRRKRKPLSTADDAIKEYFKARKAKLEKKSEDIEDPKRMFLLSLLPDMKAMSESQTRTFKRRVLALVDEILEESPSTLAPPHQ
ncbi:uncharacterized protein LOC134800639 [Cydia splendana]|uniref:uncharacterized protein LOC134800639 n=1 Tax=Cydia splendana TaxID=1100963 RepID=UPI00300C075C